jgi:hypothetical protein
MKIMPIIMRVCYAERALAFKKIISRQMFHQIKIKIMKHITKRLKVDNRDLQVKNLEFCDRNRRNSSEFPLPPITMKALSRSQIHPHFYKLRAL